MSEKLDYILAAETQKAILYPDKDHWEIEYLKEAAAELAALRVELGEWKKAGENWTKGMLERDALLNVATNKLAAIRAENEWLTKAVEEAKIVGGMRKLPPAKESDTAHPGKG